MDKELEEWHRLHNFHLYMAEYRTKDLANFLNVNTRTIQRWLKGKGKPDKEKLALIRKYLESLETENST